MSKMDRLTHLFLEVANSEGVGVCQEMENTVSNAVVLQVVHQMCSIALCIMIVTAPHTLNDSNS